MKEKTLKLYLKAFFLRYGRYVGALALFLVLIVLIVNFTTPKNTSAANSPNAPEVQVNTDSDVETYQVDADKSINELITAYYGYYANGDIVNLETLATPISDGEKSFIQMYAPYVESYENLACYTKNGISEGAYLVSVYLEAKFDGIETLAPGLDFFYIETNDEGNYFINNLYSQYNSLTKEQPTDPAISALIDAFQSQPDVIALQADVQAQYETAVNSDEKLQALINTKLTDAYATWARSLNQTDDTAAATAEEEPEAEPEVDTTLTMVTTTKVNVRDAASTDGNLVDTLEEGTEVTLVSDFGNGWFQVTYGGLTGYILSDYLAVKDDGTGGETPETAAETPAETTATTAEEAPAETTPAETTTSQATGGPSGTVTLREHNAVIIRASASRDAEQIGTAYTGEKITVIENEASGWSKVEWNGKTGYILTELLS